MAPIRRLFQPAVPSNERAVEVDGEVCLSKRRMFSRVVVSAASITGTAGVAKVVVDSMPKPDLKEKYVQDALSGERELRQREFVEMSDEEKSNMVKRFVDSYQDRS